MSECISPAPGSRIERTHGIFSLSRKMRYARSIEDVMILSPSNVTAVGAELSGVAQFELRTWVSSRFEMTLFTRRARIRACLSSGVSLCAIFLVFQEISV